MPKKLNLINKVFGDWTVLSRTTPAPSGHYKWLCRCSCGTIKEVNGNNLIRKISFNCGCKRRYHLSERNRRNKIYSPGEAGRNVLVNLYRVGATKRGLDVLLTVEQFEKLFQGNCYYCGSPPTQRIGRPGYNDHYTYNGIDRKNNSDGYHLDNCVSCCKVCNRAKSNMEYQDWINYLNRIKLHTIA